MSKPIDAPSEHRRGTGAEEEAYLKLVGERVRLHRVRLGMSRKALSQASGVSERYLAELERGTGNASLLVLRQIAAAMDVKIIDLAAEDADRTVDLQLAVNQLEGLSAAQLTEARAMLAARFGRAVISAEGRVALIGLREPARSEIGREVARSVGLPTIDLDAELQRVSGLDAAELLAVHGQTVYNRLLQDALRSVIDHYKRAVITAGAGIVCSPGALDLLLSSSFVVRLKSAAMESETATPGSASVSQINAAREAREPMLAKADTEIDATAKTPNELASEIVAALSQKAVRPTGT